MPFSKTYLDMVRNSKLTKEVTAGELSEQLRALTTIGAPAGETDGRKAIEDATFALRQSILTLVKDAKSTLPVVELGSLPQDMFTDLMFSFTQAITSCKDSGYTVTWVSPR